MLFVFLYYSNDARRASMSATHARASYDVFSKTAAAPHAALLALGRSVDESGLEKSLTELVKLRVSQINGCAFCLQLHLDIARKLGVAAEKLDLLAVWREAGVFSTREMAALDWAEALTALSAEAGSEDVYAALRREFSETETLFLTVAIGTINQWNRIAIGLRFPPSVAKRPQSAA
jgi:AhpD family alkylhydroperoxidase